MSSIPGCNAISKAAFYVPLNLDLTLFENDHRKYAAYLLNLIRWKQVCWQADEQGFVRLKAAYLRRIIRRDVLPVIRDRLVGLGVIAHRKWWVPGSCCQGYRILPEYWQTRRIVCNDNKLNARIRKVYESEYPLLPVHRWLAGHLDRLDFDVGRAEQIIPNMRPRDPSSPMSDMEYHIIVRELVSRFTNRDHYLTPCNYGRVHTLLTRLPKDLRCCLSVVAEPLVNMDIANSQPLIAGIVARDYYRGCDAARRLRGRRFGGDDGKPNPYRNRV